MEIAEKHTCHSRMNQFGPWEHAENLDTWRTEANGDHTCSFFGSMHPQEFLAFLKAVPGNPGYRIGTTDKRYKFYVTRPDVKNASEGAIKFYTWHIPDQATEDALNAAMHGAGAVSAQRFADDLNTMRDARRFAG